jgi:hypothetical protein
VAGAQTSGPYSLLAQTIMPLVSFEEAARDKDAAGAGDLGSLSTSKRVFNACRKARIVTAFRYSAAVVACLAAVLEAGANVLADGGCAVAYASFVSQWIATRVVCKQPHNLPSGAYLQHCSSCYVDGKDALHCLCTGSDGNKYNSTLSNQKKCRDVNYCSGAGLQCNSSCPR